MSFISNIFKKKPGGTTVGNLIRGVASKATSGALGNGAGIITQEFFDKTQLTDIEFYNKYAKTKNGVALKEYKESSENQPQNAPDTSILTSTKKGVVMAWLTKFWYVVVLAVTALSVLLYFAFKKKKTKTYSR